MTITASAVALVPGYNKHSKAEDRIRAEIDANRRTRYDSPITEEDLIECALTDDEIPKDIWEYNEAIRQKKINTDVRNRMLNGSLRQLQARKEQLIINNSGEAFAYVRAELVRLMDDVRSTHAVLGSVRTAEEVLSDAKPEILAAWQEASALTARYRDIRSAQRILALPALGRDDANKITAVGLIRNSLEQSEYWLLARRRAASHRTSREANEGVQNYRAWLRSGGETPFVGTEGSWGYLVWLATQAEPWVPTSNEIADAYTAAKTAVTPAEVGSLATQEDARDRYFEIVGSNPLIPYTRSPRNAKTERFTKSNTPPRINQVSPSFAESALRAMGL